MSKSKENKIERIKGRKIWPFVVMILITIIASIGMSIAILLLGIRSLLINKAENLYQVVQEVETTYLSCQESGEDFSTAAEAIYTYTLDVKSICVLDENNEIVRQYGDSVPDFENMVNTSENGEENNNINKASLWTDMIMKDMQGRDVQQIGGEAVLVDCWYVIPLQEGTQKLCVKSPMTFYQYEVMNCITSILVFLAFVVLLLGWNIYMIVHAVRERRRERDILYTSTVTGGTNIQYFKDRAEELLKAGQRTQMNYAVISIRLEKYNNLCSCYGNKEGEEVLEDLCEVLQEHLKSEEVAAHSSKADFVLLLKYGKQENLLHRIERIISTLKKVRPDQKLNFGVGIYWVPREYEDIGTMCNYVEVVQETIPEDIEDHIKFFDETMLAKQQWIRKLEEDMEQSLLNRDFKVYLQPKYSTKEEKLAGAEALVRWIHPTEGFIAPNEFIPIFEQNGFILQLDDYMISECAKLQAQWQYEGKKLVPVSVNVSRAHFTRRDLAEHICQLVDQYNVPHSMIELELTESAFFDDKEMLIRTVKKLRSYGFYVSMDDFGAGYSSLNSLKELPLDVLKLDAVFFRGEEDRERGNLIVGEAIALAQKLNMRIVAEGIETREQVDFLAEMNCDLIQGYYFAKPMPVEEFEKLAFVQENKMGE